MNELLKVRLAESGMNISLALERVAGNEALLVLLLQSLAEDTSPELLQDAIAKQNVEEAFEIAHKLKGGIGNLALNSMYEILLPLVECLREGSLDGCTGLCEQFLAKFYEFRELMSLCA